MLSQHIRIIPRAEIAPSPKNQSIHHHLRFDSGSTPAARWSGLAQTQQATDQASYHPAVADTETSSRIDTLVRFAGLIAASGGVISVVAYVAIRHIHTSFYGGIGLQPELVGLTYSASLARAALGVGRIALVATVVFLVVTGFALTGLILDTSADSPFRRDTPLSTRLLAGLLGLLGADIEVHFPNHTKPLANRAMRRWTTRAAATGIIVGLLAVVVFFANLGGKAQAASQTLGCGCILLAHSEGTLVTPGLVALGIVAEPVQIQWVGPADQKPRGIDAIDSFLYLGQADGRVILFNFRTRRPANVPLSSVQMEYTRFSDDFRLRDEVIASYLASWDAHEEAFLAADTSLPALAQTMEGETLEKTLEVLQGHIDSGEQVVVEFRSQPEIEEIAGSSAIVLDCQHWEQVTTSAESGTEIGRVSKQRGLRSEMQLIDDTWKRVVATEHLAAC